MRFLLKKFHESDKGFTLVELMVVVVIIGVLVAIAVPVYNNITIRAEQATVEANLRIIDSSILRYYALNLSIKQGYEVTLLSLPAGQGSIEATPTALDIQDPELPNELSGVEDLVEAGYLASVPSGPGSVSYGITGEAPNQRATATGVVGKYTLEDTTLNELPWRKVNPADTTPETEAGEDNSVMAVFKKAMARSDIKLGQFLSKDIRYNVGQPPYEEYNVNSWNGYLEKLLEAGNVESNMRVPNDSPNYGSNSIGYENPFSENAHRGVVLNPLNLDGGTLNFLRTREPYKSMIPPAIILARDNRFHHGRADDSHIRNNLDFFKGAMIFYKPDDRPNDEIQVYYIEEDGSKSELVPISEILPPSP